MWPVSRKSYPKQFYPLIKGRSFFQLTIARFKRVFDPKDIFISTEKDFVEFVRKQAPEIPQVNIIAEPVRRDNLAAVGLATAIVEKRFPGETMMVSWSDHLFQKEAQFLKAVQAAGKYAQQTGLIISVDEKPTYPSVHNGWVKLGKTLGKQNGHKVVQIIKHIEKPQEKLAKKLFKEGGYLINTGYRAWRTDVMLSYYKKYTPSMYQGLMKISAAYGKKEFDTVLHREYSKFEKESVEYGIFEKLPKDKRATIPVSVGWEDAGTWELFYKAMVTEKKKTVIEGGVETEMLEADNNLVVGPKGKMVSIIGLQNIVVIDTNDALLVCRMDQTGKVKQVFKKLEKEKDKFVD
jgi:mannose-1-phosphate guanylyltransferase